MKVLLNYRSKYDLKLSSAKNNLFIPSFFHWPHSLSISLQMLTGCLL